MGNSRSKSDLSLLGFSSRQLFVLSLTFLVGFVRTGSAECPGDFNGDFTVDEADARILAADWLCGAQRLCGETDLDGSGRVTMLDFGIFSVHYGTTCEPTGPVDSRLNRVSTTAAPTARACTGPEQPGARPAIAGLLASRKLVPLWLSFPRRTKIGKGGPIDGR